jgi:hypothetical protein
LFGKTNPLKNSAEQLKAYIAQMGEEGLPSFLDSFGVPFDLNDKASYTSGDYSAQCEVLRAYYDAIDQLLLSCTLWNYTSTNTHEGGDGWNGEDLSIYCADEHSLRAEKGYCRPYTIAVAGKAIHMTFSGGDVPVFEFEWTSSKVSAADRNWGATEIFVPNVWYPDGWKVALFEGMGALHPEPKKQRLYITTLTEQRCLVRIVPV